MNGNGLDAQFFTSAKYTQRNFTAVRYQYLFQHWG
jgi:hypothetical protein